MLHLTNALLRPSTDSTAGNTLKLLLLVGLRSRVEFIHIARDGEQAELTFRRGELVEQLTPPPPHLVDELATALLLAEPVVQRVRRWWGLADQGAVPAGQAGELVARVGAVRAVVGYDVLWHPGGVWVGLALPTTADLADAAAAIYGQPAS